MDSLKLSVTWMFNVSALWHHLLLCFFQWSFIRDKMDSWPLANARFASLTYFAHTLTRYLICLLICSLTLSCFTYSLIHSLTQSYVHLLSCSLFHSFTFSITLSLILLLNSLLIHSVTYLLAVSYLHSYLHSPIDNSPTYSLTHIH